MGVHGEKLALDLQQLWLVSHSHMPRIAEIFINANRQVAATADDHNAFVRYGNIPGTPVMGSYNGQVYPAWDALRDQLQRALAQSAVNVFQAADALDQIANNYAENETGVRHRFQELQNEL